MYFSKIQTRFCIEKGFNAKRLKMSTVTQTASDYVFTPEEIWNVLMNNLKEVSKTKPTVEQIFKDFQSNEEFTASLKEYAEVHLEKINKKNVEIALKRREKGQSDYNLKYFQTALCYFNDSLAHTPDSYSEDLAITYCCRAATFFALDLYDFCMDDLKRAESLGYPEKTKFVLFYNLACCHYKLGNFEGALKYTNLGIDCLITYVDDIQELFMVLKFKTELKLHELELKMKESTLKELAASCNCLETKTVVRKYFSEEECGSENRTIVEGLIRLDFNEIHVFEDMYEFLDQEFSRRVKQNRTSMTLHNSNVNEGGNKQLNKFIEGINICHNQLDGFFAIASKEINRGHILMVDNPYVGYVNGPTEEYSRFYCTFCFERADVMMIPCHYCTAVRFCSEQCRDCAWKEFHYVECGYDEFLSNWMTACLTMRIMLKIGIKKLARLPAVIPLGTQTINANLSDPMEYYNFLYSLPFMETEEAIAEAAVGVSLMLLFLEQMYPVISGVSEIRDGSKCEEIEPSRSVSTPDETLTEDEKINLGLRMVKHWLQIRSGLTINWYRPYVIKVEDDVEYTSDKFIGFNVYPLLGLFTHSCSPNIEVDRVEKGIVVFKALRQIKEGELLTVTRFKNQVWGNSCRCNACVEKDSIVRSNPAKENTLTQQLQIIQQLSNRNKHIKVIKLLSNLIYMGRGLTKHDILWFWIFHKFISKRFGLYLKSENLKMYENPNYCLRAKDVMDSIVKTTQSLLKLETSELGNEEINNACQTVTICARILHHVSIWNPSALIKYKMEGNLVGLLEFLRVLKCRLSGFSFNTFYEICLLTVLDSGEKYLKDLINRE